MFLFIYILVGLTLGPSLLKIELPEIIFSIASLGFLFIAGLELNVSRLQEDFKASVKIALGAFVLPFVVGFAYAMSSLGRDAEGAVVIAVALAISALPVVVQILKDLKMYETRLGHTIIAAATICDITAWLIFSCMLPAGDRDRWLLSHLPVLFFFIGLVFSPWLSRNEKVLRGLMLSSKYFFAPIFFIGVGMKIYLQENFDLLQCLTILLLAVVTKMIGVYLSARWVSIAKPEARVLAMVLNARGAMEILFCAMALKLGLIDGRLFTSLTIMAVVSSLMAAPLVKLLK